jgi:hypothetical protein
LGAPSTIITTDNSSNNVVPLHNLPNLQQGQNGVEVAFTIYGIVLDVTAHLPGLKEVTVTNSIVLFSVGSFIVDCHYNCNKQLLLLCLYYLFAVPNELVLLLYYLIITETLEDCY